MSKIGSSLRERLAELVQSAGYRKASLQREIVELEKQAADKKAALDAANLASKRAANFQVQLGADYQCPRCWIEDETRSAMHSAGGGTYGRDFMRCGKCGDEIEILFR